MSFPDEHEQLLEWAHEHKTMILLNGGYSKTLRGLFEFFDDRKNPYPFAHFCEGEDALDGALTCVGIILPEKIYGAAGLARKNRISVRDEDGNIDYATLDEINQTGQLTVAAEDNESGEDVVWEYNSWEAKLIAELNNYGLAN